MQIDAKLSFLSKFSTGDDRRRQLAAAAGAKKVISNQSFAQKCFSVPRFAFVKVVRAIEAKLSQ
jgi:hypothetical protein